jgi:hypothetical protein
MRQTLIQIDLREITMTKEELIASFKVCPICGFVPEVEIRPGIFQPKHDMAKHGLERVIKDV